MTAAVAADAQAGRSDRRQSLRSLFAGCLAALGAVFAPALPASAQDIDPNYISRDLYRQQLQQEGNAITFCYNERGMMAEFDQALADALGSVLLLEVRTTAIPDTGITTPPLDYRLPLLPEQLFVVLAESCSAIMGYALSPTNPEWLSVTRPYMSTRSVLVVADEAVTAITDLPYDRPIGARAMSVSDNRLINFLQARAETERWPRHPYYDNRLVLERVADGTLGAGLVWEPALYFATDGDPEAAGYRFIPMPFEAPGTQLGIATRSNNTYINGALSSAIDELIADGTLQRLMEEHHLTAAAE